MSKKIITFFLSSSLSDDTSSVKRLPSIIFGNRKESPTGMRIKEALATKCKNPNCDKIAQEGKTHCSGKCFKEHYNKK
ncbi:MAG: hypothetical protein M0R03_15630 [Novosphingobium sp.]|nr:hypothetical protein [Novosphingobium sp.]